MTKIENAGPEDLFALALKLLEPDKVPGGTEARQDWLRLLLDIQIYLRKTDRNVTRFIDLLLQNLEPAAPGHKEAWVHRYPKGVDHPAELNPEWRSKQAPGVGRCRKCRRIIDLVPR